MKRILRNIKERLFPKPGFEEMLEILLDDAIRRRARGELTVFEKYSNEQKECRLVDLPVLEEFEKKNIK